MTDLGPNVGDAIRWGRDVLNRPDQVHTVDPDRLRFLVWAAELAVTVLLEQPDDEDETP